MFVAFFLPILPIFVMFTTYLKLLDMKFLFNTHVILCISNISCVAHLSFP